MATSASECPTAGRVITCRAAIAWHSNRSLKVEEIDVAPPKAGEVRVKILYTGVCQTDAHALRGEDEDAKFPFIPGHEGGGIVESIGEGVTSVKPGDHVIPLYIPQCKKCKGCCSEQTNLCETLQSTQSKGVMPDGTTRFSHKGKDIYFYMGTSTFSEYTVLPEISVAKIDEKAPLDKVCLIGCGIPTGYGGAINTAKVTKGSTCAVWGLGCVGLATVMGCKAAGATRIIGIDPNPPKWELAKQLGATECMNPDDYRGRKDKPLQEVLQDMTDGGLDFTFECVGDVKAMKQAMEACRKGWGVCTIIGVAPSDKEVSVKPGNLISGRVWKGSAFGGYKSRDQVPNLVDMYMNRRLKVDEFITHHFQLEDINDAFKALDNGEAIRSIIQMGPQIPTRST